MKEYKKTKSGSVGYLSGDGWFHSVAFQMTGNLEEMTDATPEEIEKFERDVKEWQERQDKQKRDESELLKLCGLTHEDFVRFRNVFRNGDILSVETRENGVNERSVDAIRNPNFKSCHADDFDSTYEHYEFTIPVNP